MSDDHVCPRRAESSIGTFSAYPQVDHWGERDGYQACSYCGSMHPDALFKAIESGCTLTPTDKNYKVYVDLPHPDAGKPCVLSSANFPHQGQPGWVEITPANRATLPLDAYQREHFPDGHWVKVEPRGPVAHAKFYFQHLSDEQQRRFIDLLNAGTLKLATPGHFYRLPFFVTERPRTAPTEPGTGLVGDIR